MCQSEFCHKKIRLWGLSEIKSQFGISRADKNTEHHGLGSSQIRRDREDLDVKAVYPIAAGINKLFIRDTCAVSFLYRFLETYYLRQVNEVNGGDNVFVHCVCVCLCVCVCAAYRSIRPL